MSEEHNADETAENRFPNGISRRSALQKIGAASAVAIVGGSGVASADVSSEHKESVLSSPEINSIREKVDGFNVQEVEAKSIKRESTEVHITNIDTDIGDLMYAEIEGGPTGAKLDLSHISYDSDLWEKLRNEYNVVKGVNMALIGGEADVEFEREVTDYEQERLEDLIPEPAENIVVLTYSSVRDGYVVKTEKSQYHVGENMDSAEPIVQAQYSCAFQCAACGSWAVSRGICYAGCATAASGAGAAVCIACLFSNAAGLAFVAPSCQKCADCI